MKKIFEYWQEFFVDLNIWWRYRRTAIRSEELLLQNNMRVDWLGRIYTVVNMPEEVQTNQEMIQQGWVISQLKPMNDVLLQIGLADYSYPTISRIPGSVSFLVIMWPEVDTLNPVRFLGNVLLLGLLTGLGYIAYRLLNNSGILDWALSFI